MKIKMRLNELFEQSGLKKKHAAKYVNVDATTMSNWINGKSFPRLDQAVGLAKFFNVDLNELFLEEE
ncbi:helix-turn-helix transcriptional regulator [Bacillaceae bacterium W0354]